MGKAKVAETALATIAPEALLAEVVAKKAAVTAAEILTGDLAVVRVAYPRGTKKNPLPPVLVEYHVNLASIGVGAFLVALAALVGVIAWEGTLWTPGIKDSRTSGVPIGGPIGFGVNLGLGLWKGFLGLSTPMEPPRRRRLRDLTAGAPKQTQK